MSDLTKEELRELSLGLALRIGQSKSTIEHDRIIDLVRKIQSLIDNYCEHDNDFRFNAIPLSGSPKLCTKCEMFYI